MRILFTGGSSFTGLWFIKALNEAGHEVVAPLRGEPSDYAGGVRGERVRLLEKHANVVWGAPFGGERFVDVVSKQVFDVLCHHAAQVGDYRSPEFDVAGALAANTRNAHHVLRLMRDKGLSKVVLTGSVFEQGEGAGEAPLRAFSPYGLSKGLTSQYFTYWCSVLQISLGKFVISNPFGPYEEPRFCGYLIKTWKNGLRAGVRTPDYIRDNIHVRLLANAYHVFVGGLGNQPGLQRINPSGYVEAQGVFAKRFASEMAKRLGLSCDLELSLQTDFSEPRMRVNTDPALAYVGEFDEGAAWDELANYYRAL
ncbi:NAD-dependent epimerase/dehydratase family protein [Variovorax soli]|uniref:NAD-dependent epimerase/dehydratase family protein n=1 Tax=Variovorax soli TaxID=376815 RepID=UPI0009FD8531|nr:NAD(P)-dependent oxidoreductase [Variovorax soli]